MTDPHQQYPPQAPQPGAQPAGQPAGQPQGYPPQGQYQGQPHQGQPHQGQGYPAGPPTPRASGSALGRIAFIVALVALGIRLLSSLLTPLLYIGDYYGATMGFTSVIDFVVFLGNAGALAVGIVALRRSGPHLLAAIAIGLAGAAVVGYLATALSRVVSWFAY